MPPRLAAVTVLSLALVLAGCSAIDTEHSLRYADSLDRSAAGLRQYGLLENAAALEQDAARVRRETRSSATATLDVLTPLFDEFAAEESVGFIEAPGSSAASPQPF